MPGFFEELKRRNVVRVGILYAVAGWLLLQIADVLFSVMELPGWSLRFVLALLMLGFPMALIFAWVFEMTPEGLKLEKDIQRDSSITPQTGRKIDRLITIGAVLVAVALIADRLWLTPGDAESQTAQVASDAGTDATGVEAVADSPYPDNSIAVLPFVNMSGDEDNEYFSDGLTEELLNLLAKIGELRVSSRTSSFAYKGKDVNIPTVARELNVAHVLEGSVRKADTRVRITAQLIDVATDAHLWSETYDRQLDDIFAIQDEIARAVVDALKVELLVERGPHAASVAPATPDAYLLYLRGKHLYNQGFGDVGVLRQVMAIYESALEADPDYALAYAGMADVYGRLAIEGEVTMAEGYEKSRELVARALALQPDLVEALLALADIQLEYDWDMADAEASYRKALSIRPGDADGLRSYAYFLNTNGRYDEAEALYRRTLEIDPMQRRAYRGLFNTLIMAEKFDAAREHIDEMGTVLTQINVAADDLEGLREQMMIFEGRWAEVVAALPAQPEDFFALYDATISYHHLGDAEKRDRYLAMLVPIAEKEEAEGSLAEVYAQIGRPDEALAALELVFARREVNAGFYRKDPFLRPLHGDPRFSELLVRYGLDPVN
jgi:serine/threonine-protein kinase